MTKMKQGKAASRAWAMWVVMMIILVQSHVSIAAQDQEKNINGTNNNNSYFIGIIEKDFDSEFPDAISSHFHGRVLQKATQHVSSSALNPYKPVSSTNGRYLDSSPINPNGAGGCHGVQDRKCGVP